MANEKNKNNEKEPVHHSDDEMNDVLETLYSQQYGVSSKFLKENDDLLDATKRVLSEKFASNRNNEDKTKNNSNVAEYTRLITSVMNVSERIDVIDKLKLSENYTNPSGAQSISDDSSVIDKLNDSSVIDELMCTMQNHFTLMPEYAKICDLIPEIGKSIDMIVRDIVNVDEFSQSFISNFYDDNDSVKKTNIETRIKNLLKEYDFEGKIRKWLKDAEIAGVKPFSILPQNDVIDMINKEIEKRVSSGKTIESVIDEISVENVFNVDQCLLKSPLNSSFESYNKLKLNIISTESSENKRLLKSTEDQIDRFVESIITPDIIDEWSSICIENFNGMFETEKLNNANDLNKYNKTMESMNLFNEKINDVKNIYDKTKFIKNHIKDLIVCLDRSIEVVDPMKTPLYEASRKMKNNRYGNFESSIDKGIVDNFYRVDDGNDIKKVVKKTFNIDGFDIDISDTPIDEKKYAKVIKNKRAILTEYEPEYVIPVSSGGTHVGYYVIEYLRTSGDDYLMLKKDKGSFADIIRRMGVGEDKALVANTGTTAVDSTNPFGSGVFSPSTIMTPMISNSFGGVMTPYGGTGIRYDGINDSVSNRRTQLVKTLLIKTIAKRLGDESLIDNGTFQSSLMNVIRDDILFRNRVRFSFIPESHMVYMSRELNSAGYPVSALSGTLFNCYIYLSSLISSIMLKVMKSSDTEIMEVNVGKSKELGLTIGAISQNASTRNVSARTLFGGTDNIVRSVGNYKKVIVPVVNGEKLFDINQIERMNNVDIDDDFTERNLKSVILKIGTPPTSLDMMSQDEYVASQTQHRIDYRNLITDRDVNYSKFVTKAIRLLVYYSDSSLPEYKSDDNSNNKNNEDNEIKIDISKINFNFALPKNLSINKITDELANILTLIDDIIKIYYGEADHESPEWNALITVTKRNLLKELSSSTDWSMIDQIINKSRRDAPTEYLQQKKFDIPPVDDNEENGGEGGSNPEENNF